MTLNGPFRGPRFASVFSGCQASRPIAPATALRSARRLRIVGHRRPVHQPTLAPSRGSRSRPAAPTRSRRRRAGRLAFSCAVTRASAFAHGRSFRDLINHGADPHRHAFICSTAWALFPACPAARVTGRLLLFEKRARLPTSGERFLDPQRRGGSQHHLLSRSPGEGARRAGQRRQDFSRWLNEKTFSTAPLCGFPKYLPARGFGSTPSDIYNRTPFHLLLSTSSRCAQPGDYRIADA